MEFLCTFREKNPLGTTSKPNRRFRTVSIVLNNDNCPEPAVDRRLGFEATPYEYDSKGDNMYWKFFVLYTDF